LPLPDLSSYDLISTNAGTNDEIITFFSYSQPVSLSPGDWFLTAVNVSGGPASYSIKATEYPVFGTNIIITAYSLVTNSFCITWTSLPGVRYSVQGVPGLGDTNWVTLSPTIVATGFTTTYCIPLPSIYHFFRIKEGVAAASTAAINFTRISRSPSGVLLEWVAPSNYKFNVQWSSSFPAGTWNTFSNLVTSTNTMFSFLDDGSQSGGLGATRFYRLVHVP
jgi:hypothetical protein